QPAAFLHAAVGGLHHAAASAGDHGPAALAELACRLTRGVVGGMLFVDARRAEHRHRSPVDLRHPLEAGAELGRDLVDRAFEDGVLGLEDPLVVHQNERGTCAACMPRTSSAASPTYVTNTAI